MHLLVKCAGAMSLLLVTTSATLAAAPPDAQRSFKAEVLFRLANPCPSTGETRGECRGYVIDRVIPMVCGGAEEPGNMQWQTIAQAREKGRWERIGCRPGRKLVIPGPPSFAEAYPLEESPTPTEVAPLPVQ
ncbi:MAG: exported protein of unknown function [Betaproteobacteria bacterium]|jgi:hypothetical protein|nr:exported protein of unknown function [Betaproteobacteria bacterium]MEA3153134.1 hypothetical protein [Betaproteobacteria bacterium]